MRNVLLLDISDHVAGRIAEGLEKMGCTVCRPQSLIEFTAMVGIASDRGWTSDFRPDVIVNFHSQKTSQVMETCKVAELLGIRVMNPTTAVALCDDRRYLLHALRLNGVEVPDFFYGHPSRIPHEFGGEAILKDLRGHLVMRVRTRQINSRDELIYGERVISNPGRRVRTVYSICGKIFTVEKHDALQSTLRTKRIVVDDPVEISVAEKIRGITNLDFFNVDFIGDTVIDVNAFPNFFSYEDAVDAMVACIAGLS